MSAVNLDAQTIKAQRLGQRPLEGLNAVVTGGSRGIGQATAQVLAEQGANVNVAVSQSFEEAEQTCRYLQTLEVDSFASLCDVADEEAVEQLFGRVVQRWGGVDILINNAGIVHNAAAEDMTLASWRRMIDVNLTGVFLCAQAAGRAMIAQRKGGAIVNVSSICAHIVVSPQKQCHYNAAKGGVTMLTKSLAAEWAPHNIRVNSVAPGYVGTKLVAQMHELHPAWQGQTPMGRLAEPEEIAEVIAFMAGPKASFVTGSDWVADGGYLCW